MVLTPHEHDRPYAGVNWSLEQAHVSMREAIASENSTLPTLAPFGHTCVDFTGGSDAAGLQSSAGARREDDGRSNRGLELLASDGTLALSAGRSRSRRGRGSRGCAESRAFAPR